MADKLQIRRLKEDSVLKPIDCGDDALNDFIVNDVKRYQKRRLAVSYFGETESKMMFSLP